MSSFTESVVEDAALAWLEALGYAVLHGPDIATGESGAERNDPNYREVVLSERVRQALFRLPGEAIPTPEDIFGIAAEIPAPSSPLLNGSSPLLDGSSPLLGGSSPLLDGQRNPEGCLLSDWLSLPIIDDLARLAVPLRQRLEALAAEPRSKGKISREKLISVVLALCAEHFITLKCLADLLNRRPKALRDRYLTGLVQERKLSLAFPKTPTHERQAYCTSSALSE